MKLSEVIDRALNRISPETWGKGDYMVADDTYCFLGHCNLSYWSLANGTDYNGYYAGEEWFAFTVLIERWWFDGGKEFVGSPSVYLPNWNDSEETSYEDVVLGMKHFAEWAHNNDEEIQ